MRHGGFGSVLMFASGSKIENSLVTMLGGKHAENTALLRRGPWLILLHTSVPLLESRLEWLSTWKNHA